MWWIFLIVFALFLIIFAIIKKIIIRLKTKETNKKKDNYHKELPIQNIFISQKEIAGLEGEMKVDFYLKRLLKGDEYLLTNVILPIKNNNMTTEIDSVMISRKGVFCIEIKNWSGKVIGSDDDDYWIQKYNYFSTHEKKHLNPVKQNYKHCLVLERFLNNRFEINCVVIFTSYKENIKSDYTYTIESFQADYNDADDVLSIDETKRLYQKLLPYVGTKKKLKEHQERVIKNH